MANNKAPVDCTPAAEDFSVRNPKVEAMARELFGKAWLTSLFITKTPEYAFAECVHVASTFERMAAEAKQKPQD